MNKLNTIKIKKIIATLFVLILAVVLAFVFSPKETKVINISFAENGSISTEVKLNDEINLSDYYIKSDKDVLATDYSIIYPNGYEEVGRKHIINIAGKYTVKYSAKVNDSVVFARESFVVKNSLYSSSGEKSSYYYGVNSSYDYAPSGLVVSIAKDEEFYFNKIIDLSQNTSSDTLFSFYITPNEKGTYDASFLTFRLTDIHDENNYVDITYRCLYSTRAWAKNVTYIVASSAGNKSVGGIHYNDIYGFPTYQTFCGTVCYGKAVGSDPYNIMFDYNNRQIWTDHAAASQGDAGNNGYIADLDDASIFTNPWKGFSTGEVYLSVFASSYQSNSMNIVLTKLQGYDLTEDTFTDDNKPNITIDYNGEDEIPNGIVGKKYKIFDATAIDDYSENINVEKNIYLMYGKSSQVTIKNEDGYFYPTVAGTYTIEYLAEDSFGNVDIKTVDVVVNDVSLNTLNFSANILTNSGISGCEVKLFNSIDIINASGNTNVKIQAINNDIIYDIQDDYKFVPLYAGSYKIVVTVSDYIDKIIKEVGSISITANDKPVFADSAINAKYFITGEKYTIANQYGYDLSSGIPQKIEADTFIVEDNGNEKQVSGEISISAKNTIKIIYKLPKNITKTLTYDVINPNKNSEFSVVNYFNVCSGDIALSVNSDYLKADVGGNGKFEFTNPVQVEDFSTKFEWYYENNSFDKLNIYLVDSLNENIKVKFSYTWNNSYPYLAINDSSAVVIPRSLKSTNIYQLFLGYSNKTKQAYGNIDLKFNVSSTVSGDEFVGFPSNKVYVSYEFENVSDFSTFYLTSIDNQSFYDFSIGAQAKPQIFVDRSNGDITKGDIVKIYTARVYSVLSSTSTFSLSVYDANNNVVTANDGTLLENNYNCTKDYEITASMFGKYTVCYVAVDSHGKKYEYSYGFNVKDLESPELTVDTRSIKVKLFAEVNVKDYSVLDNVSTNENIKVFAYLLDPNMVFSAIENNKFVVNQVGTYYVYFYCFDELNNMTVTNYAVVVTD